MTVIFNELNDISNFLKSFDNYYWIEEKRIIKSISKNQFWPRT